jgi:hypothetical protein
MRLLRIASDKRIWIGATVLFVGWLGTTVVRAIIEARGAAAQNNCDCNMSGNGGTLANYYSMRHEFPSEILVDDAGQRLSWTDLLDKVGGVQLDCPTGRARFAAVCGAGAILFGEEPTRPAEVSDGCENTLILVELTHAEFARAQGSSDSFQLDALEKLADVDGNFPAPPIHPHGRGMIFGDCTGYRQIKPLKISDLRALCTKAGGESVTKQKLVDEERSSTPVGIRKFLDGRTEATSPVASREALGQDRHDRFAATEENQRCRLVAGNFQFANDGRRIVPRAALLDLQPADPPLAQ